MSFCPFGETCQVPNGLPTEVTDAPALAPRLLPGRVVPGAVRLAASPADRFGAAVDEILAQPYQSAYVPLGLDGAFEQAVVNTAPAEDYTTGSIPGSPDLPAWPAAFSQVLIHSADGAPLLAQVALHPGTHPGRRRRARLQHARLRVGDPLGGAAVRARLRRDRRRPARLLLRVERRATAIPDWLQTFGWKESEDVLAAGRYLAAQPGVGARRRRRLQRGRAEHGARARARRGGEASRIFSAGLTFSGPADQNTQASTEHRRDATRWSRSSRRTRRRFCGALDRRGRVLRHDAGSRSCAHETAMHAQT